jgi:hypothetical protein
MKVSKAVKYRWFMQARRGGQDPSRYLRAEQALETADFAEWLWFEYVVPKYRARRKAGWTAKRALLDAKVWGCWIF